MNTHLEKIWKTALKSIKEEIPISSFQAWVKPANLVKIEGNKAYLEVKNEFSRNLILQNYERSINKGLEIALNKTVELIISVNSQLNNLDYTPSLSSLPDSVPIQTNKVYLPPTENIYLSNSDSTEQSNEQVSFNVGLNSKFTFDNFIVGTHNQFCHAVALSIAEKNLQNTYNPFFIYGGVGLGKTHIMHAIGNYIVSKNPKAKVLYITTEKFLNDLIGSMRRNKMNEFREKYRSVNLLMIDDIQFIEGKETTQEEFFHTFNALKDNGSQIILTSDRPPSAISRLEARLCSRFEAGLVADVQAPAYETRLAIISSIANDLKLTLPKEIPDLIAQHFPENIRRLEGAVKKLQAYINFSGFHHSITTDWVKKVLQITENINPENITINISENKINKFNYPNKKPPIKIIENTINNLNNNIKNFPKKASLKPSEEAKKELFIIIQNKISEKLNIDINLLLSRDNTQEIKEARQICIYIARTLGLSLSEISLVFDGRGNSSLLNAYKKVKKEIKINSSYKQIIDEIETNIKNELSSKKSNN